MINSIWGAYSNLIHVSNDLILCNATCVCPWLNDFSHCKLKLIAPQCILRTFTLWVVQAHANTRGNCIHLMCGCVFFFMWNDNSCLDIRTQWFSVAIKSLYFDLYLDHQTFNSLNMPMTNEKMNYLPKHSIHYFIINIDTWCNHNFCSNSGGLKH